MAILVFSRAHVEAAVSPERALEAVRDAFVAYARGEWTMPPKTYVPAYPAGDFRAMPALGAGHALLKWVASVAGKPAKGPPTGAGRRGGGGRGGGLGLRRPGGAGGAARPPPPRGGAVTAVRTGAAAVLAA